MRQMNSLAAITLFVGLTSGHPTFAQDVQTGFDNTTIDTVLILSLVAILLAPIALYLNRIRKDAIKKRKILNMFTPHEQNIILVMASVAKTDNEISDSEVLKIRDTIMALTSRKVSLSDVRGVLSIASNRFTPSDIQGAVTGLSVDEKRAILMALFGVIAADGKLRKQEREFSRQLCKSLQISQAFFDSVWVDYFELNPNKLTVE